MKVFVLAAAAGVAAFAAAPASAQLYAGAGYSTFEADYGLAGDDLSFAAAAWSSTCCCFVAGSNTRATM
jgi:hypothetical protein